MNLEDEMENIRQLNGKIEAVNKLAKELGAERTAAKDRIHDHMADTLKKTYGSEYLPRITLYVDERVMARTAKPYTAKVVLEPIENTGENESPEKSVK